jgi:GNAT superfamily N-acetyltransferase
MSDFEIIPFNNKFVQFFINLNIEWLEFFFEVEPYDYEILKNCEALIINKGGYIFFAKHENEIIGTFAFINRGEKIYELVKMAIKPDQRGKGYGNKMIEFAISFGKKNNWKKIYLYSSTKLKNSIYLYKKHNFKEVRIGDENPYKRGDIKMELYYNN